MSNWVTTPSLPEVARARGTMLASGSAPMTTPAAWVEAFRQMPSSRRAMSMTLRAQGSPS